MPSQAASTFRKRKQNETQAVSVSKKSKRKEISRASTTQPQTFHRFLHLPPEIRAQILEIAVKTSKLIEIRWHPDPDPRPQATTRYALRKANRGSYAWLNRSSLAVALTSRLMYLEAIQLYYAQNSFHFRVSRGVWQRDLYRAPEDVRILKKVKNEIREMKNNTVRLQRFVTAIGPLATSSITSLTLSYDPFNYKSYKSTKNIEVTTLPFPNLKHLEIRLLDHGHEIPPELEALVAVGKNVKVRLLSRECCSDWDGEQKEFLRRICGEGRGGGDWEMISC